MIIYTIIRVIFRILALTEFEIFMLFKNDSSTYHDIIVPSINEISKSKIFCNSHH